jgi:ABC-type transport system substrate-binding protein
MAQVIEQQLRKVDIKLKLTSQDLLTVWLPKTLGQGDFEMTNFTHLGYEDPDLPLRFYLSSDAALTNSMGYKDEEVDRAILAAARELDEANRVDLTKKAQRVIIRKWAPMLNLYSPIGTGAAWDYVKGIVLGRGSINLFNTTMWLDK